MSWFRKKAQTPPISRMEALACIPEHTPGVQWRMLGNGQVLIEYQFNLKPFLHSLFKRFTAKTHQPLTRKIELDLLGSQVWQSIDGQKSVREVISLFAAANNLTGQEAEAAVTTFLRMLGKRGLIGLRNATPPAP